MKKNIKAEELEKIKRDEIIEECAQVAENTTYGYEVAQLIRKLKNVN